MIGQTISHYKILEKLGEGGMGVVYKAQDTKLERLVALKFLPSGLTGNSEAKERFFVEARAAAALNHANIITVHEIGQHEDRANSEPGHRVSEPGHRVSQPGHRVYIAMEYVRGENLKEKIASGPLPTEDALRITKQLAKGLQEAHEQGVIHRDIKSANIMIDEKGRVKIMDFGLARLKGRSDLTKAGSTLGTANYMSPEQTQGADVDHRTDIWSLGVVLYEIVTGQTPFKGEYEQAVIYSILNEEPEPLSSLRAGIPPELERIINKMLAKSPAERYQTASHLLEDVKALKEDSAPEVTPSRIKTSPEINIKASRKSIIAAAVFLATVVLLAAFLFIFKGKPESSAPFIEPGGKPSLAVVYFENNSGNANLDNWRSAFSELLTTDLSQSKYIRVLRSDEVYGIFKKLNLLEARRYSADDLKNVARDGGVNHILKGSYIKAGEHFKITAMLIDANTGKTISSLSVKAEGEKEIFAKVDQLTKEIKSQLNISSSQIADDMDEEIGRITTSSSEALKYYIEGRAYFNSGEYDKSIKVMEKAVAIDPQFAMAYRSMAFAYGNQGFESKGGEYIRRALEYRHRSSAKERYIISGDYYWGGEGDAEKAIATFEKILELYPGDFFGHAKLGEVYTELGEWEKVIGHYEECRKNGNRAVNSYNGLAEAYNAKKLYHRAEEVLKEYLDNYGGNLLVHRELYFTYAIQRKFDLARAETEKIFSIDPTYIYIPLNKGDIYYFKDRLKEARKEYIKLRDLGGFDAKFYGWLRLAQLNLVQGKIKKSREFVLKQIDASKKLGLFWHTLSFRVYAYSLFKAGDFKQSAEQFNRVWGAALQERNAMGSRYYKKFALLGKGLIYLELDAPEQALQAAKKLKALAEKGLDKRNIAAYYSLLGMIELKQKKFDPAAGNLVKAIRIMSNNPQDAFYSDFSVMVVDRLAAAYLSNGHLEKARESYEQILSMTYNRMDHGDIYAKSYYRLGKIYRQKGMKEKALKNYKKFIQLWQECDPQFRPLLEDAQKQVVLMEK
jgi:serine/threonine protein kinase/Tfp pilus assembly protein PilF